MLNTNLTCGCTIKWVSILKRIFCHTHVYADTLPALPPSPARGGGCITIGGRLPTPVQCGRDSLVICNQNILQTQLRVASQCWRRACRCSHRCCQRPLSPNSHGPTRLTKPRPLRSPGCAVVLYLPLALPHRRHRRRHHALNGAVSTRVRCRAAPRVAAQLAATRHPCRRFRRRHHNLRRPHHRRSPASMLTRIASRGRGAVRPKGGAASNAVAYNTRSVGHCRPTGV